MSDKDAEYILWFCKRLVFKYNEDENIIKNVEEILSKYKTELSFYKQTHESIDKYIDLAVQNLNQIRKYYTDSVLDTKKVYDQYQLEDTNHVFENFDIEALSEE